MLTPDVTRRGLRLLVAPLVLAGLTAWIAPVAPTAAGAVLPPGVSSLASFSISGRLNGVVAISASDAWATGCTSCLTSTPRTLIVHWNGKAWDRMASPTGVLSAVTATSATNVWAVGSTSSGKALILRWNGKVWKQVPSPSHAGSGLSGVVATSLGNAWAVGGSLILHWTGTAWTRVPSPSIKGDLVSLLSVAATSPRNAWAVGSTYSTVSGSQTLIESWNGKVWKRVPSPSTVSNGTGLSGVVALSTGSAWAVGCSECGLGGYAESLIERWNGKTWKQVAVPSRAGNGDLFAVASVSTRSAWAAGGYYAVSGESFSVKTVTERWNGNAWKRVSSPSPGAEASVYGLDALSTNNAWAVGAYQTVSGSGGSDKTLILHWNGKAWK
jgi:hypothetical protein